MGRGACRVLAPAVNGAALALAVNGAVLAPAVNGAAVLADRKKDLVKLQAGEYVALSKVEMVLKMSPLVDNILVYGDSTKLFTVSLVVPSASQLRKLAATLGVPPAAGWAEICTNPAVEKAVLQELQALARKGQWARRTAPPPLCPALW